MNMNDPFNRSRLPATFDRAGRVALIGRAAQDLLAGRMPDQEASLFLAGRLLDWLQNGGSLVGDHFKVVKPKSHVTPSVIWQQLGRHQDERQDS